MNKMDCCRMFYTVSEDHMVMECRDFQAPEVLMVFQLFKIKKRFLFEIYIGEIQKFIG